MRGEAQSARRPDVAAQSLRCPPSLLRQSSAFEKEGRYRGPCIYWPTAAPLVRNSPRGWAPKTLPDPEVRVGRAEARGIVGRHADTRARSHSDADADADARKMFGNRVLATAYQPLLPHRWVFRQRPVPPAASRQRRSVHPTKASPARRPSVPSDGKAEPANSQPERPGSVSE